MYRGRAASIKVQQVPPNLRYYIPAHLHDVTKRSIAKYVFYRIPKHLDCHVVCRQMQAFYAIKLLCSGTR
jgi:hypothetical protein